MLVMGTVLLEIECLKLINLLCSSAGFVRYLGRHVGFVGVMVRVVEDAVGGYQGDRSIVGAVEEERLLEVFGILQKISFSKIAITNILKTQLTSTLIQQYLRIYSTLPPNILTYVLALLLNIILKP